MPLLIDAYNVLQATGALPQELAGLDVEGLVDLIALSRYARQHAALVCDGHRRSGSPEGGIGHISIIYSGGEESADDAIAAMVTKSSAPRRLLVVTSDRDLAAVASRRRCNVIGAHEFLTNLADDWHRRLKGGKRRTVRKPQPPLSPAEVDYWLSVFGLADRESGLLGGGGSGPSLAEIESIDMDDILKDDDRRGGNE